MGEKRWVISTNRICDFWLNSSKKERRGGQFGLLERGKDKGRTFAFNGEEDPRR
jgi:hypothetical protein